MRTACRSKKMLQLTSTYRSIYLQQSVSIQSRTSFPKFLHIRGSYDCQRAFAQDGALRGTARRAGRRFKGLRGGRGGAPIASLFSRIFLKGFCGSTVFHAAGFFGVGCAHKTSLPIIFFHSDFSFHLHDKFLNFSEGDSIRSNLCCWNHT